MEPSDKRPEFVGAHPVVSKRYLIETPAIDEGWKAVEECIQQRRTGMMITGEKRAGKTFSITHYCVLITECFPGMPVGVHEPAPYERISEKQFFEDMLEDSGCEFVESGKARSKRRRLCNYMLQCATAGGHSAYVLFVDEAQNLLERSYRWLTYVSNWLKRRGVDLIVILIGQDELLAQRAVFVSAKKGAIVGRFMPSPIHFSGLRTSGDFKACLQCYDKDSAFPEGSGWPFSRYFFPAAWKGGWRVADLAMPLWRAFSRAAPGAKTARDAEVPMQYFCRAVEHILINCSDLDSLAPNVPSGAIAAAVEASGYSKRFSATVGIRPAA